MQNVKDFGWAVDVLKGGFKVAREGWNGKGMFLYLAYKDINFNIPDNIDSGFSMLPFIVMKTASGDLVPWLASQTDILAEDWITID